MKQSNQISNKNDEVVDTFLKILLADEYVLYTKTRTAHWNVDKANNFELNVFLENQYNALDLMIDEIADQIRLNGHYALGSLKNFLSISQIVDDNPGLCNSQEIFETLLTDHQEIISIIQHETNPILHKFNDQDTANLLVRLMEQHQKQAWMLRSFMSHSTFNETGNIHQKITEPAEIEE